ncbi:TraB/GumN family protein [Ginsengibacter hankyongi]|uniref:TraB/GumN family protein n=1 Tax=Ginsengibacter hankyongi TaxID=2607284 RepID=A0A5J5I9Y5_9BACT|nr:TraB/GumN family protein [Ginsengibacter hankyongi]KAA9034624.1 TraB/GumN family protein [Ginsengibacter hankyongi]
MKFVIVVMLICFGMAGCHAQQEHSFSIQNNNKTLLWQVSGNGLKQPSFLFGTFHLLCKDDIHFGTQLKDAVKESNEIYMELDMDDPSTLLGGMLYMNMKDGKKLSDLYTPEEYQKLKAYFTDTLNTPFMMFQKAKPYFLVALIYPKMMNCPSPAGVEEELLKIAKEDKKEIKGLETILFQASVFDSIPYEWQAKELLKNIDSFSVYKNEFDEMIRLYKNQELDSMQSMVGTSEFGSEKYEDLLLNDRNKKWVKELNEIMKTESVFVAVGAGHLSGNNGLIALLKKEGYTVEPLVNK